MLGDKPSTPTGVGLSNMLMAPAMVVACCTRFPCTQPSMYHVSQAHQGRWPSKANKCGLSNALWAPAMVPVGLPQLYCAPPFHASRFTSASISTGSHVWGSSKLSKVMETYNNELKQRLCRARSRVNFRIAVRCHVRLWWRGKTLAQWRFSTCPRQRRTEDGWRAAPAALCVGQVGLSHVEVMIWLSSCGVRPEGGGHKESQHVEVRQVGWRWRNSCRRCTLAQKCRNNCLTWSLMIGKEGWRPRRKAARLAREKWEGADRFALEILHQNGTVQEYYHGENDENEKEAA